MLLAQLLLALPILPFSSDYLFELRSSLLTLGNESQLSFHSLNRNLSVLNYNPFMSILCQSAHQRISLRLCFICLYLTNASRLRDGERHADVITTGIHPRFDVGLRHIVKLANTGKVPRVRVVVDTEIRALIENQVTRNSGNLRVVLRE